MNVTNSFRFNFGQTLPSLVDTARVAVTTSRVSALGVGVLIMALAGASYLAYRSLVNRVHKNAKPTSEPVLAKPELDFTNIKNIERTLVAKSQRCNREPNFDCFEINGKKYTSIGPAYFHASGGDSKAFYERLSTYPLVINLISQPEINMNENRRPWFENYLQTFDSGLSGGIQYTKGKTHQLVHIKSWPDKQDPPPIIWPTLLQWATEANKQEMCFVHCLHGLQRTATFIAIAELIRHPNVLKQDNKEIKQFIYNTLEQLCITANGRIPNSRQLECLFSAQFIRAIKNFSNPSQ